MSATADAPVVQTMNDEVTKNELVTLSAAKGLILLALRFFTLFRMTILFL
jgi:hypothetical protein